MLYLEEAREVYHQMKLKSDTTRQRTCMHVDQRLKLLKKLMEEGEIPMEYSVCCSML